MRYLILSFLTFVSIYADFPLFIPPADWECALPEKLSPFIKIGFIGKGSSIFRPSINLATEEIDVNLKEYVKAVKEIHLAEPNTTWRDLGKFVTRSGPGRLIEITSSSPLGEVKILQLIFVKDTVAYILTGAALKKEFIQFQNIFTQVFQSLTLTSDLFTLLPLEKKKQFEEFFAFILSIPGKTDKERDEEWRILQKKVLQETPSMGSYWQFLVLQEGREKIYNPLDRQEIEDHRTIDTP